MSGRIAGLAVSVPYIYAYRDWMPHVLRPGPDGGSPMNFKAVVTLANGSARTLRLRLEPAIEAPDNAVHAIAYRGPPLVIAPGASAEATILTRDGPYLPERSRFDFKLKVVADSGEALTATVAGIPVRRTD